jgi:hypothetical protein
MSLVNSPVNSPVALPVATIPITLEISIKIFQGSHGKYYYIDYLGKNEDSLTIYYDIHFPLNWLFNEEFKMYPCPSSNNNNLNSDSLTGPNHCSNCRNFGYYNGVFIGYCLNCAAEFENSRGNGMTDIEEGLELNEHMVAFDLTYFKKEYSIWNTYLKNVSLQEIGDLSLKADYDLYKDLPDLIPVDEKENDWNLLEELLEDEEQNRLDEYSDSEDSYEEWKQEQLDNLMEEYGDKVEKYYNKYE